MDGDDTPADCGSEESWQRLWQMLWDCCDKPRPGVIGNAVVFCENCGALH